jgi:hypothetical protein
MVDMPDEGQGPRVAVFGTGITGSAMARNLIAATVPQKLVGNAHQISMMGDISSA